MDYPIKIDRHVVAAVSRGQISHSDAMAWGVIHDLKSRGLNPTNATVAKVLGRSDQSVTDYVRNLTRAGLLKRKLGRGPSDFDTRPWVKDNRWPTPPELMRRPGE